MGEAGPEAIMPLKRDSNGVLGVRGGSSNNVEVVVNNYSSEKATTKETTDSRGNKRIEVIVGEAVATQIVKTGSAVQRSMGGAYGLTPQLIRR
jgi:phage-related minor tail protein